ncbi:MAG: agmatinase [Bacillota bacterium]
MTVAWQPRTPFLGSSSDRHAAKAVILGAPMDWSSSFRPGSRFGPAAVREVSEAIEEYSPYADRALGEVTFYDAGDLVLPFGSVRASLALIGEAVAGVLAEGKFPLLLGGEHLITYPAVQAFHARYPELCLLHLDAHADLRAAYLGEELSHASVIRLVHGLLGDGRIFQCGIRSGDREEFAFAREHTRVCRGPLPAAVKAAAREIGDRPLYVTLDIDVVDPAFAPGTGTPECAGATSAELLETFAVLGGLRVVGFDLVEVSPAIDLSARTSLLAAVVVREALLRFIKA